LQQTFKDNGCAEPVTFTYPFGAYSKESVEIIKELGFKATLGCQEGVNYINKSDECLYMMKRYNRANGASIQSILSKRN
jgi:hypothetical protein